MVYVAHQLFKRPGRSNFGTQSNFGCRDNPIVIRDVIQERKTSTTNKKKMASNYEKVILACMVLCCLVALVRCEDEEQDVAGQSVRG